MDLKTYLDRERINATDFASKVGASRSAVHFWLNGKKRPRDGMLYAIYRETRGQVTPNDIYGVDAWAREDGVQIHGRPCAVDERSPDPGAEQ